MHRVRWTILLLILMAGSLQADTLYLRNGSVLQGVFVGFENGQFIFQITSTDDPNSGRTLRFAPREVLRLVIDRQSNDASSTGRTNFPNQRTVAPGGNFESFPPFEVRLMDQWTRSDVQVTRGQRVRIEASGQIYLNGRTPSSPAGTNRRDPDAPLPNEADGALIAAIGNDPNSPAILIGRSREFTADRDGVLYFTVNHWETTNAQGSYQVRVSVERNSGTASGGGTIAGRGRGERTFTVYGNQPWVDTGIEVEPGMRFEITASGRIDVGNNLSVDPTGDHSGRFPSSNYPLPSAGPGTLIAKIRYRQGGDSNILAVGTNNTLTAEQGEYGRLWLGINDDYFNDNRGSFTVRVRW